MNVSRLKLFAKVDVMQIPIFSYYMQFLHLIFDNRKFTHQCYKMNQAESTATRRSLVYVEFHAFKFLNNFVRIGCVLLAGEDELHMRVKRASVSGRKHLVTKIPTHQYLKLDKYIQAYISIGYYKYFTFNIKKYLDVLFF